jgi:hypothetical protein
VATPKCSVIELVAWIGRSLLALGIANPLFARARYHLASLKSLAAQINSVGLVDAVGYGIEECDGEVRADGQAVDAPLTRACAYDGGT